MPEIEQLKSVTVPWTARHAWLGLVACVILSILITVFFLLIAGVFDVDVSLDLILVVSELVFLVPVWWFVFRKYNAGWGSLGFRTFTGKTIGIGCGLVIAAHIFTILYAALIVYLLDSPIQPDLAPVAEEMSFPWLLAFLAVVVAPVVEEIFFRGFVFAGFYNRYGYQKAAILSSLIFALGHLQVLAILPLFILGYIFAYLYHRSGSIVPAIILHFLVNLFAVVGEFVIGSE